VPVWWAWVGYTFYANRFETDDTVHRLVTLAAMLATGVLSINIGGAFEGSFAGFAFGYAGVRLALVVLYVRAWRHVEEARPLANSFGAAYLAGAALWAASAVVDDLRLPLAIAGMAIEVAVPLVVGRRLEQAGIAHSHLPERFGLLIILVLGESIVDVGAGFTDVAWEAGTVAVALAAFTAAAMLWWTYFDFVAWAGHSGLREADRTAGLARDVYAYGHFPVVVGMTALAAGADRAVHEALEGGLEDGTLVALCGGVALCLVALAGIHLAIKRSPSDPVPWLQLAGAAGAVAIGVAGARLSPVAVAAGLAAVLVAQLAASARFGATPPEPEAVAGESGVSPNP
jgi:low temperature requirement protein LtrA